MTKIMTTERLKGNPWRGADMDKDRRTHNTKKNKSRGKKRAKKSS